MSQTEDESDPLDGADIGETVAVREPMTLHAINFSHPDVFRGSDRYGYPDIADVELVENDEGYHDIRIIWEGEVTKQLPRRWDRRAEPVTEREKRQARRRTWAKRIGGALSFLLPWALVVGVAWHVMGAVSSNMTINGEPMAAPDPTSFAVTAGLVVVLAAIIHWGVNGGFPGTVSTR